MAQSNAESKVRELVYPVRIQLLSVQKLAVYTERTVRILAYLALITRIISTGTVQTRLELSIALRESGYVSLRA